jgi:hypothetical protein
MSGFVFPSSILLLDVRIRVTGLGHAVIKTKAIS